MEARRPGQSEGSPIRHCKLANTSVLRLSLPAGRQLLEQTSLMEAARAILQSGGPLVDALPEPTRRYLETNEAWEVPPQPLRPPATSSARAGAPGQAAAREGSTSTAATGRARAAAQGQRQASSRGAIAGMGRRSSAPSSNCDRMH